MRRRSRIHGDPRRRREVARHWQAGGALAALLLAAVALLAVPSEAAESYELAGTVTEAGCGGSQPCTKLPSGEHLSVSIESSGRRIDSVPVGGNGRYAITLPAGYYQVTPGLLGNGPVALTRFSPETLGVGLQGDVPAVDFTYEVAEQGNAIGRLRFDGAVGDVPFTQFSIGHGTSGKRSKTVVAVTEDPASIAAIQRAIAHQRHFPKVTFEAFKHGTRRVVLFLSLRHVDVSSTQVLDHGAQLRFTLEAEETTTER